VARLPTPVWGRDELRAGEMWNSNSVVAWLLVTAGIPTEIVQPPERGRAPGWGSGLVVADRGAARTRTDGGRLLHGAATAPPSRA
jgi:hypothetical protein